MSIILDSNGTTIKWTGTVVPSPYFVQANPRGIMEWFAIVNDSTKINITNYAKNIQSGITYFTPPGGSAPIPFNNIVTTLITDMSYLFYNATAFNQPIDSWNTSNVTTMYSMFYNATMFNQPIGSWNTSNVTNMSWMFAIATMFNQPIDSWNTSNVTTMYVMFYNAAAFNQPIGSWKTLNVNNMSYMFFNAIVFNQNISSWIVGKIPSEPSYFSVNSPLIQTNKPLWGVGTIVQYNATITWVGTVVPSPYFIQANPRGIMEWFAIVNNSTKINITNYAKNIQSGITYFTPPGGSAPIPFNNIVTTLITDMSSMFDNAVVFNQSITSWDISNVVNMQRMFYGASLFNQPIGVWNTSNVIDTRAMFYGANSFNQDISSWNRTKMRYSYESMFQDIIIYKYKAYISSNTSNYNAGDSSYTSLLGDSDEGRYTITITNPFIIDGGQYKTLYIHTNGSIQFKLSPYTYYNYPTPWNDFALFCFGADLFVDTSSGHFIRYKETADQFIIIYNLKYYARTSTVQAKIIFHLQTSAESGKITVDFGTLTSSNLTTLLGISFGLGNSSFINNNINFLTYTETNPYIFDFTNSPIQYITNIQSNYSNKQLIITPAPVLSNILLSNSAINENVPVGTIVGTLSTDQTSPVIYTFITNPSNTFAISGSNIITNTFLNYTMYSSYNIVIRATVGSTSITKPFTISITDIPQSPTGIDIMNGIGKNIPEDSPKGTFIGDLYTFDPDRTDNFIYQFVNGSGSSDNQLFILSNGKLYTNTLFNYRNKNRYSIRLQSKDATNLSVEQELIFKIIIPYSPDSYVTTLVGREKSIQLTGNAVSGKLFVYQIIALPKNGSFVAVPNSNGKYVYTANKSGNDFLTYVIREGTMTSDLVQVNINNYSSADVASISRKHGTFIFDNVSFDGDNWRFGTFETDTFMQNGNYSKMGNFDFYN